MEKLIKLSRNTSIVDTAPMKNTLKSVPHIAIFIPNLKGGGAERIMLYLANGFSDQGLKVDMVLGEAAGIYLPQLSKRVRVVDLKASRMIASLPGLVRYLRRERPNALISSMDHSNLVAALAVKLARIPICLVLKVDSTPSIALSRVGLKGRLMLLLMRVLYRGVSVVIPVSQGAAEDLIEMVGLPRNKTRVIHNPVVTPELFRKAEIPLEHPWFHPGQPPVVLGVGRLSHAKDFPTLIKAFAMVRRRRPSRLVILGEGEDRPQLEMLVKDLGLTDDEVDLPGFVDNPYQYMQRAAVFVLSSKWEGFGNVLAESMAVGTPVVSTDCLNGPSEILENGKWGRLVPVEDNEALADAVIAAMDEKRGKSVNRAMEFTLDNIIKQYKEILNDQI